MTSALRRSQDEMIEQSGWEFVRKGRSGHSIYHCPCGKHRASVATTPSDQQWLKRLLTKLRSCPETREVLGSYSAGPVTKPKQRKPKHMEVPVPEPSHIVTEGEGVRKGPIAVIPEPQVVTPMDEVIAYSHTGSLTQVVAEVIRAWHMGADASGFTANTLLRSPQIRDHEVVKDKSPSGQIRSVNGVLRTLVHRKVIYQSGDRSRFGETKYRAVQPVTVAQITPEPERSGTHFYGDGHDHGPEPALDLAPIYEMEGEYVKGTTLRPDEMDGTAAAERVFSKEAVAQAQEAADAGYLGTDDADPLDYDTPSEVLDRELDAMRRIATGLDRLPLDVRRRVLTWAADRFVFGDLEGEG